MDAWKLHEESAPAMDPAVMNQFLQGMAVCSDYGTPLALLTFCGSALKEVAKKRLPAMLVEEEEKYGCYSLIRESRFVPWDACCHEQLVA